MPAIEPSMTNPDTDWWVYLVRCSDRSLYTGVTTDLVRRVDEHNGEQPGGARYTRARRPVALVWSERCDSRSAAQRREATVRKLSRWQKDRLIDHSDPGASV
jgi:putative endonuclease